MFVKCCLIWEHLRTLPSSLTGQPSLSSGQDRSHAAFHTPCLPQEGSAGREQCAFPGSLPGIPQLSPDALQVHEMQPPCPGWTPAALRPLYAEKRLTLDCEGAEALEEIVQRSRGYSILGRVQNQVGWGFKQPGLVESVHGRGVGIG